MDPAYAQCARLPFDARKWYLSKLAPKKWRDRATVEHSGLDGAAIALRAAAEPMSRRKSVEPIGDLLREAEWVASFPDGEAEALPDHVRLQRLLLSGEPLPPAIYSAVVNRGNDDG
jgi:hypothetical protein